jgi:GrpB-like predicted nucleotidyltransferase (UPF0157 family)
MPRGPKIVPYRDGWPQDFAVVSERLHGALGSQALGIEHIGSTSVLGLAAKDVIDVQISVATWDGRVQDPIASLGFRAITQVTHDHVPPGAPDSADEWRKLLYVEPAGDRRINLHVRQSGRLNERYALLFRDYLRAHPRVAEAYAELKRRLSASLAEPESYPDVKDPAVDLIYLAAEDWAAAGSWRRATRRN